MVANSKISPVTPIEYLESERAADTKSEYFDGVVVAMSGASPEHDRAVGNIFASLHGQLKGSNCEPFTSDMRVRAAACNRYFYPDTSVACSEAQFEKLVGVRSLENPVMVVEVLSGSTESIDRGDKLICYQTIPSLQTYVIVALDRPLIQVYERRADGSWIYTLHQGLDGTIHFPSIACKLSLEDIYYRVRFPQSEQSAI